MSGQKQYVGNGKEFGNYGNVKISLKYDKLQPNAKGYVNLIIGNLREKDQYGNTKCVYVDDYVQQQRQQITKDQSDIVYENESDLPF